MTSIENDNNPSYTNLFKHSTCSYLELSWTKYILKNKVLNEHDHKRSEKKKFQKSLRKN